MRKRVGAAAWRVLGRERVEVRRLTDLIKHTRPFLLHFQAHEQQQLAQFFIHDRHRLAPSFHIQ